LRVLARWRRRKSGDEKPIAAKVKATIKVLSAEGKLVGDAHLRIRPIGVRDEKDIVSARTDAAGNAKIEVSVSDAKAEVLGNLVAVAPNIGIGEIALKSGDNTVTLMPAGPISVRVVSGNVRAISDYMSGDDFYAEGAGSPEKPVALTLKKGETAQQDFVMKRAVSLSGDAVDESGKPVKDARILTSANPYWPLIVSGEGGKWKLSGQKSGTVKLDAQGEWQLISPQQVTLPRTEPLRLVLRAVKLQNVAGRVVTPDGKPVEGVRVIAQLQEAILRDNGPEQFMGHHLEATSDAQGRFVFEKLGPRGKLQNAVAGRESFGFVSGEVVAKTARIGRFLT
jgi:hypothetical protein